MGRRLFSGWDEERRIPPLIAKALLLYTGFGLSALGLFLLTASPARALDQRELKKILVQYRSAWIAPPDVVRAAAIGPLYRDKFDQPVVCVALDEQTESGFYTGLRKRMIVVYGNAPHSLDPKPTDQVTPYFKISYRGSGTEADCPTRQLKPFPEILNAGRGRQPHKHLRRSV